MSDLISRRMMLDKMIRHKSLFSTNQYEYMVLSEVDKARADEIDNCIADLRNAPDAEPERKTGRKFLEIVVNYPKVCTYPEYEDKPYYSIKYEENGEMIVGFGTYKPEVLSQYLREYFISPAEPEPEVFEWCHDCKEYDQEKHCCHRWTKVIRNTVEEVKSQYALEYPKIIHCEDCKWWDRLEEGHPYGDCRACRSGTQTERWDIHIQRQCKFDFYCADAEPIEDEEDHE
jgi:hypothetical protein